MRRWAGACALLLVLASPAHSQAIIQGAVDLVVDGENLVAAGTRIRLWGIRALASEQRCIAEDSTASSCGRTAAMMLDILTRGRRVECRVRSAEGGSAPTAQCRTGTTDLAGIQVLAGNAIDVPVASGGYYRTEQVMAIERRAGFWTHPFPWPFPGPATAP